MMIYLNSSCGGHVSSSRQVGESRHLAGSLCNQTGPQSGTRGHQGSVVEVHMQL